MANPSRGEVSLDVPFDNNRTDHFVLKFTNAGHRAMEDFLGMESSEVLARINTGRMGPRLTTGLFYGATRKFHRNDFPDISSIDDYMDEIDDESDDDEDAGRKIFIALLAAYTRSNPSEVEAMFMGEEAEKSAGNGSSGPKKGRGTASSSGATKKKAPSKTDKPDSGESS